LPGKFGKGRHSGLGINTPGILEIAVDVFIAPVQANGCQVGTPHASLALEAVALYAAMFMKQERTIGRAAGNKKAEQEK
jgi:hypothetical protein